MKRDKKAILLSLMTTLSLMGCTPKVIEKIDENRETIVYDAFDIIKERTNSDPNELFMKALENIKRALEVKARRVGGATTPKFEEIVVTTPTPNEEYEIVEVKPAVTINPIDSFKPVYSFAYVKETSPIYDSYTDNKNEIMYIDMYQKVLIETSNDYFYSVKTEDGIVGYMNISNLEILPENYVEVDLSSQTVRVVDDYEEVLNCYVVTGAPGHDTNEGYTEILDKTYDRPLVGPTWNVDVNYFFPFNYSEEGFHDASWRDSFGGNIYTYNGSHGCVNMRRSDVEIMDEHVEVGTKVLVHK